MDELRKIEQEVFGDEWRLMTPRERNAAERAFKWSARNFHRFPISASRIAPRDVLFHVMDEALLEIYSNGLCYFMRKTRTREIVEVRYMCFYIARNETSYTLTGLAKIFGFTHPTLLHAFGMHEALIATCRDYAQRYKELYSKIKEKCERLSTSCGELGSSSESF